MLCSLKIFYRKKCLPREGLTNVQCIRSEPQCNTIVCSFTANTKWYLILKVGYGGYRTQHSVCIETVYTSNTWTRVWPARGELNGSNNTRAFSGEHSHPWNALCAGYFGHWSLHDVHYHSTMTLIDSGRIWLTRKHNDRHGSSARPHYAVCPHTGILIHCKCNAGNHADELTRLASAEQHPQQEQEEKGLGCSHYYAFG